MVDVLLSEKYTGLTAVNPEDLTPVGGTIYRAYHDSLRITGWDVLASCDRDPNTCPLHIFMRCEAEVTPEETMFPKKRVTALWCGKDNEAANDLKQRGIPTS